VPGRFDDASRFAQYFLKDHTGALLHTVHHPFIFVLFICGILPLQLLFTKLLLGCVCFNASGIVAPSLSTQNLKNPVKNSKLYGGWLNVVFRLRYAICRLPPFDRPDPRLYLNGMC